MEDFETETVKTVKEVTVVQDQGLFKHDTGDTYEGYFEAKKKDRSVKMHGFGVYTTAEGDTYSGVWEADKLGVNDDVTIKYADGASYSGRFRDFSYNGRGQYVYPDTSFIQADFVDNMPVGNITLIDPNGHKWLGRAELGYAWFEPVNHFYDMLGQTRESKRKLRKRDVDKI